MTRLTDPRWRAMQRIPAQADGWTQTDAPPEGEVLCAYDGDQVRLTPDGWLAYVSRGKAGLYVAKVQATEAWVADLRGETGSRVIRASRPVLRER